MVCWHNTGEAKKLKQKSTQGKKDRADSQSHDKEPASAKQRQRRASTGTDKQGKETNSSGTSGEIGPGHVLNCQLVKSHGSRKEKQ